MTETPSLPSPQGEGELSSSQRGRETLTETPSLPSPQGGGRTELLAEEEGDVNREALPRSSPHGGGRTELLVEGGGSR